MIKEIANVLKNRLIGLPFIEVVAGLAQRVEYVSVDENENKIIKRMPVSYDTTSAPGCHVTPERALVPDSQKKGILYFEDNGITFLDTVSGGAIQYQANLTLVCWMNRARLVGDAYAEISSYCITNIIQRLGIRQPKNEGNFSRMQVLPGRIMPQDYGVFSRYTYDETTVQYLRPPYEFFGMLITVTFCIHPACINDLEFKAPVCY